MAFFVPKIPQGPHGKRKKLGGGNNVGFFSSHMALFRRIEQLVVCAFVLVLLWLTVSAIPKRHITLGVGPVGGTYFNAGLKYKELLEKKGYHVDLRSIDATEEIVHRVNDPQSGVDAGFSAQDLRHENVDNVVSFGEVEIEPIFVFARRGVLPNGIHSFSDLRGLNVVLPPEGSVTSKAALEIFKLFRVDGKNTQIHFLPLRDAVEQLQAGRFDAGLFMLSASNTYIRAMAQNDTLELGEMGEIDAIAKQFPFLRRATLPAGIYDLDRAIPARDTSLLAAKVSLVAKKDIAPATSFALLEAMSEIHRVGSYVSEPGEFPSFVGTDLPLHPLVEEYRHSGTPWIFEHMPMELASVINKYLVALLALWVLVSMRREIEELTGLRRFLFESMFKGTLIWVRRAVRHSGKPGRLHIWLVARIDAWVQRDEEDSSLKIIIARLHAAHPDAFRAEEAVPPVAAAAAPAPTEAGETKVEHAL